MTNAAPQRGPTPQKHGKNSDHANMESRVTDRERCGAYMGNVMRPRAASPSTSAKSCAWIVVKIRTPLIHTAVAEMASRSQVEPVTPVRSKSKESKTRTSRLAVAHAAGMGRGRLTHELGRTDFECGVTPNVAEVLAEAMASEAELVVSERG